MGKTLIALDEASRADHIGVQNDRKFARQAIFHSATILVVPGRLEDVTAIAIEWREHSSFLESIGPLNHDFQSNDPTAFGRIQQFICASLMTAMGNKQANSCALKMSASPNAGNFILVINFRSILTADIFNCYNHDRNTLIAGNKKVGTEESQGMNFHWRRKFSMIFCLLQCRDKNKFVVYDVLSR